MHNIIHFDMYTLDSNNKTFVPHTSNLTEKQFFRFRVINKIRLILKLYLLHTTTQFNFL